MSVIQASAVSVFDMLKIGVGPSSSHTLGPWLAIKRWLNEELSVQSSKVDRLEIHLYGSLALTGKGHATDIAVCLALLGCDPVSIDVDSIADRMRALDDQKLIFINSAAVRFDRHQQIVFHPDESLPAHPNGMRCIASGEGFSLSSDFFSIGGGFVLKDGDDDDAQARCSPPYAAQTAKELLQHCEAQGQSISGLVRINEEFWNQQACVTPGLYRLWDVMLDAIHRGCCQRGELPGGLHVVRRAHEISSKLLGSDAQNYDKAAWLRAIQGQEFSFSQILQWLSCFALAVNEENAAMGRIVTAPTNGAAGVIPAVLMYHLCFNRDATQDDIERFLLVAGEVGTYFKKGATISAAQGGCQAEIGVSSAMAAAALTEVLGGSPRQALMAAEIAMEHHLGLTCDPVAGLVQVPCIERNAMGAVKAVNAAQLALVSHPEHARVSLDAVIATMDQTAKDMNSKYKETSLGGLAVNIPVGLAEC